MSPTAMASNWFHWPITLTSTNTQLHKLMKNHTTQQGNHYYIDGVFAFITFGAPKLTFWEDAEELENWVDAQY